MAIQSDKWIIEQCESAHMIRPFSREQVRMVEHSDGLTKGVLSFGVSSYGYDMRLGHHFRVLRINHQSVMDPKNIDPDLFETFDADDYLILPPHGLALGQTIEYFKIPRDILTICIGKSTYARCGVFVNVTPFEPEWEGFATIAISNLGPTPVRLYAGEGIAQLIFLQADEVCAVSYQDKKGKYQTQTAITTAKV